QVEGGDAEAVRRRERVGGQREPEVVDVPGRRRHFGRRSDWIAGEQDGGGQRAERLRGGDVEGDQAALRGGRERRAGGEDGRGVVDCERKGGRGDRRRVVARRHRGGEADRSVRQRGGIDADVIDGAGSTCRRAEGLPAAVQRQRLHAGRRLRRNLDDDGAPDRRPGLSSGDADDLGGDVIRGSARLALACAAADREVDRTRRVVGAGDLSRGRDGATGRREREHGEDGEYALLGSVDHAGPPSGLHARGRAFTRGKRSEDKERGGDARGEQAAGETDKGERLVLLLVLQQALRLGSAVDVAGQIAVRGVRLRVRERAAAQRDHSHSGGDIAHGP